jgi:hypothetical protein
VKLHRNESDFQDEVIKEFRAQGWYAAHLSPANCPGWQDVIALRWPYGLVLELKDYTLADYQKPAKDLFTAAQRPRYLEQLGYGIGGIWLGLYDRTPDIKESRYELTFLSNKSDVIRLGMIDTLDLTEISCISYKTAEAMVRHMITMTKGVSP